MNDNIYKLSIVIAVLLIIVLAMAGFLLNDYIALGNPNGPETETTEAETTDDTTSPLTTTTTSPPTTTTGTTQVNWWDPSFSTTLTYTVKTFAEKTVVTRSTTRDFTD